MAVTVETSTLITQLYAALFGRAPDAEGLGFWSGLVGQGRSLAEVANAMFATTPARAYYPAGLSNQDIVASFYRNVLGREADSDGLSFWTGKLNAPGATPGSVIVELIRNVAKYEGVDPAGLLSQQLFNNKVAVALHYAQAGGGIAIAGAILANVSADPATVTAAIAAIDEAGVEAPLFMGASVTGDTLVMSYADAGPLDAAHPPAASAFAVTVGGEVRLVRAAVVDAAAKTVTLTLASAAASGEAVTVAYADPSGSDDASAIQDAGGNDAASLGPTAVTNNTPVGADITPPAFAGATVNGASLVLRYTDAGALDAEHIPPTGAFSVRVAGVARGVNAVAVNATEKTVTLTLESAVAGGETVTVAYTDPTAGNDLNAIQDASGNDAPSRAVTAVVNNTPDAVGPVFSSARVTGSTLVMTYTDLDVLDATHPPPVSAFTVQVGGAARAVNAVAVNANAKTVTLTLASPVLQGDVVTVEYRDPTDANDADAIQDAKGNDALSLAATAVTNNTGDSTAPVFASATVTSATLVMTYTDLGLLDAAHPPAAGAFSVTVGGVPRTVNAVTVNAGAKTVTLALASAVANGETVTVAYTDPTAGNDANAIQDGAGNDAASLAATAVTNNTPVTDTTPPVFASATVNGSTLVMTYTEADLMDAAAPPPTSAFQVRVGLATVGVNAVAVDANLKTVTLTLATPVVNGDAVTVAYTDPTGGNDANAIQDVSGNDAATLSARGVTNNTPDVTAPVFSSAAVNGSVLVMTYTDASSLDAAHAPPTGAFSVLVGGVARGVSSVAVNAGAKTVTLTLASAVAFGETVTVAYADPTAGNDVNAIQDAAGNDAASLSATTVTNNSTDVTAPVFAGAAVNTATLVLTYTEQDMLDASNPPPTSAFNVMVEGAPRAVSAVAVNAASKTVTLTLASAVAQGQEVTVAYTDPTGGNDVAAIQDRSGNDAVTFGATVVTNNTPAADITAPVFASAAVNGTSLVLNYADANLLDEANIPGAGAFEVLVNSIVDAVIAVDVDATARTVTLTLATAVTAGQTVTVAYTDPTAGNDVAAIQDAAGNDAPTLGPTTATNNSPLALLGEPQVGLVGVSGAGFLEF